MSVNPFAPAPRLTISPAMPNQLLLTHGNRVAAVPIRQVRGHVLFDTDLDNPPDVEVLGPDGQTIGRYPVQLTATGAGSTRTYRLLVKRAT